MAIQEIEKKEMISSASKKGIDKAAEGLIFDIVQSQQYTKPVPSAVREIVSNSVDAQLEKEKAIDILEGRSKPEDYFVDRPGDLYKDSKWQPEYYDLSKLDKENNNICITFETVEGKGRCCKLIIEDYGVGIGLSRLNGITKLGYSTKRCRKDVLGSFGIGAKSGLATGADYYIMETVHNGIKYKLKLFNANFQCLIGKFDSDGQNIPYVVDEETVCYGKPVTCKNYTKVEIPVMKHHRQEYDTAVRTQLMFFKNVKYFHKEDDNVKEVDFHSDVHYNSDNLIIADNVPYSKPYIIIVNGNAEVGVNYGYIEFEELELEQKFGSVGIKCNIRQEYENTNGDKITVCDGVDVVPSRESIRWTKNTKDYLLNKFTEASTEASNYVTDSLKETDFLIWLDKCLTIIYTPHRDRVLSNLSKIIDIGTIRPQFNNTNIRYSGNPDILFTGYYILKCKNQVVGKKDGDSKHLILDSHACLHTTYITNKSLIYAESLTDKERIQNAIYNSGEDAVTILIPKSEEQVATSIRKVYKNLTDDQVEARLQKTITRQQELHKVLKDSSLYSNISDDKFNITEEFLDWKKEQESGKKEKEKGKTLSPAELRALQDRIVVYGYEPILRNYGLSDIPFPYRLEKQEPKLIDVINSNFEAYYGSNEDKDILGIATCIFKRTSVDIWRVAKNNFKHFKSHKHITSLFGEFTGDGKSLIMHEHLVKWNTARRVRNMIKDIQFLNISYKEVDDKVVADFEELYTYAKNYFDFNSYESVTNHSYNILGDFHSFLDKMELIQNALESGDAKDEIESAKQNLEVDIPLNLEDVSVVDAIMIEKAQKIVDYVTPLIPIFNCMNFARNAELGINPETEQAMREYIKFKEVEYE